jgi:hypothetical protein
MNLIERAKNIIIKPKEEWIVIEQETTSVQQLVTTYLIPLALIPAIAAFVRYGFFGIGVLGLGGASISWGVKQAVVAFISPVLGAFLSAFVIDLLAPSFGSVKDFRRSMQLVVYSYTPMLIAGIFQIIPALSILGIVGLYGLYLLYLGIAPIKKSPEDKVTGYFIVSLIVLIGISLIMGAVFAALIMGGSLIGRF